MPKVILLLASISLGYGQGINPECRVTMRVVDSKSNILPYRVVSFQGDSGWDYADRFVNLRAQVPCSLTPYRVVVTRSDVNNRYSNVTGMMDVVSPENWKTLVTSPTTIIIGERAGAISFRLPPGYVWRGHVEGALGRRLWVHIRSAVGPTHAEAETETDGSFRFYHGFLSQPYLLYVVDDQGNILFSTTLKIHGYSPDDYLVIKLPSQPPEGIVVR